MSHFYSIKPVSTILFVREGEDDPVAKAVEAAKAEAKAEAETAYQARLDAEVKGLKDKNSELLGKIKAFDGLDPAQMKQMKERLDQDEDAKLLAEGKKNVVIEKYTERMRASHAEELKAKDERIAAEAARADAWRGSVLDNQIRAVTSGLHKGAVEDALLAARQLFTLDAKGNAVQLDSEGTPVLGKDGKTPFSPSEWIELQRQLKPHWFPIASSGSGSGGSRESGKTVRDLSNLSPTERLTAARAGKK